MKSSSDDKERIKLIENDIQLHTSVRVFLSFCNQVSIAHRFGVIHKKMAFDIWHPFIPYYWDKIEFYIKWRRENGYNTGNNFQAFAKAIKMFNEKNR